MSARRLLALLLLLGAAWPAQAREFRTLQPIARPETLPPGVQQLAEVRPVDRALVEQAVHAVAAAWNTGELDPLIAADFADKSRLLDTLAEVVPRNARLSVLSIQSVSTLGQYFQAGRLVSIVSAVVRTQVEFVDPRVGYQRLEGSNEWTFRVE